VENHILASWDDGESAVSQPILLMAKEPVQVFWDAVVVQTDGMVKSAVDMVGVDDDGAASNWDGMVKVLNLERRCGTCLERQ
jgi:hypothetical protein